MAAGPLASLAMYPFAHVRDATDELWRSVRRHLDESGRKTTWPAELDWSVPVPHVWKHPRMIVAWACGWPLVTELADTVVVVGAFDHDVPGADSGHYRAVVVTRLDATLDELLAMPDVVGAVNGFDSLSGRVSLENVWGTLPTVMDTGAHLDSVRALAAGEADVATIDAVSWAFIGESEPELTAGLHIVGSGPRVPCLPVVASKSHAADVPALRAAFAAAVADPATRAACHALHISGFVPLDLDDYLPVLELVG